MVSLLAIPSKIYQKEAYSYGLAGVERKGLGGGGVGGGAGVPDCLTFLGKTLPEMSIVYLPEPNLSHDSNNSTC